jgi:DNA repair protein REV1
MALLGPGGRATNDAKVIGDHAWRLLKSFNHDPKELRGIGIHVQKLESSKSTSSSTSEQGQATLLFKPKRFPQVGTSKEPQQPSAMSMVVKARDIGDPIKPQLRTEVVRHENEKISELPSFSQVDMTVFEALPKELREELEKEYKRRSASPFPGANAAAKPASRAASAAPPLRRSITPNVFPQRRGPGVANNTTNVKRITQQLAPRTRSSISPDKSALYAWASKPKGKKGIKVSEKALRELNLDPEVFFELPIQVQSEQLAMARILRDKGSIPEPPKKRKILKPRKHELPPDFVPYIAPKPKARHPTPPCLRQHVNGQKLAFTETDDVQRVVESWVMGYHKWAPREKDVDFLCKYLVQSVDRSVGTDVGVERSIKVMKWWLVLLRRLFPASEVIDEEDEEDGFLSASQRDGVGEAWWAAFRKVKGRMDQVARKRFGGVLALR